MADNREIVRQVEVGTVGELKVALYMLRDDMPVADCMGAQVCVTVYEEHEEKYLEVT